MSEQEYRDQDTTREGIEIAVQIRDLGDRKGNGCPTYYTHREYCTEGALAGLSNRDLVASAVEMATANVVSEWRKNREVDD